MSTIDFSKNLLLQFPPYQGLCLYLSFERYETDLSRELALNSQARILWQKGRLFLVEGWIKPCLWAQSHWREPTRLSISSIGSAQKILRRLAPRWVLHSEDHHRRSQLIQEGLRSIPQPKLNFLANSSKEIPHGVWTLEDPNTLWYSLHPTHPLPLGQVPFIEDKVNPPSRAYLKLWELFTLHGLIPSRGERVADMGSCPGGWTWVLQSIGCHVLSVDKAPLDEKLRALPGIETLKKDAFSLKPEDVGPIDWFFSDIICYPEKLLELVQRWRASGLCRRFVCTIKFQGESDFGALEKFAGIEHSRLIHLFVNKHEVTWICIDPKP